MNGDGGRGREGDYMYLPQQCQHQNDSCINKMGSNESHFNVWLIVKDKVTRQYPQTTEKGQPKWNWAKALNSASRRRNRKICRWQSATTWPHANAVFVLAYRMKWVNLLIIKNSDSCRVHCWVPMEYYRLQNMWDCVYHVHHNGESEVLVIL